MSHSQACTEKPVAGGSRNARVAFDRFAADRSGMVAPLFGFLFLTMVLSIGGAVDMGRWLNARAQTKAAVDAAVLAATRKLQIDINDPGAAIATAQRFYAVNTAGRIPVSDNSITFQVSADGQSVAASGTAWVATPFLALARVDRLPIIDTSGAEYAAATMSQGHTSRSKLEVSVMLDVTGSMSGSKISDLKAAAKDLVDILVRDGDDKTRVALAPFSDAVRPGALLSSVRASGPSSKSARDAGGRWRTYYRTACVAERSGSTAYTDHAPVAGDGLQPVYTRDGNCNPDARIVPLTSTRSTLTSTIDGLTAQGYTAGHLGTAWAWYLLSPEWSSVLPQASTPASYGDPEVKKVAVLMTDGEYNTQYDSNGIATRESGASPVNGGSNVQARQVCDSMKAAGVTVYTIGFALDQSSAIQTLAHCASSSTHAYIARNGDELRQAFRDIALTLAPIHLTR